MFKFSKVLVSGSLQGPSKRAMVRICIIKDDFRAMCGKYKWFDLTKKVGGL
jgi:hypothetical protein